ncbi:MAG: 3-oxoadipyl-CoA thiolase [Pseudomonadota bacterium]
MAEAFICDAVRTPIGRFGGALSSVRADDLAAIPIRELLRRNSSLDAELIDDLVLGCANQAGEDNRNVARMAALLAGLPEAVPGVTLNRLCGSGMDAVLVAARQIKAGDADLVIAGGVESMSRAPFVMPKADNAFSRNAEIYDTTIGWRFVNPLLKKQYGIDSMPETGENVAADFSVSREDQDLFAYRSQQKTAAAQESGFFDKEIVPVSIPQRRADPIQVTVDEHPRADTKLEKLATLRTPFRADGSVTAGNASGVNDGSAALIVASEAAVKQHGLTPRARVLSGAVAGVAPRIMGIGPAPAAQKVLERCSLEINQMDAIELNEAFAAQALASARLLGLSDDDPRINPNGGAIALGHPLGMSGTRLLITALNQLEHTDSKRALCAMCIGVGQGIASIIERV